MKEKDRISKRVAGLKKAIKLVDFYAFMHRLQILSIKNFKERKVDYLGHQ